VNGDLDALKASNNWQPGAAVMLTECMAGIVLEVDPKKGSQEHGSVRHSGVTLTD
jgi:hypothetical protein